MAPHTLGIGYALHPDQDYLTLARPILEEDADYFEVNPETLWRPDPASRTGFRPNDFHDLFRDIRTRSGKPVVAHGLAFSPGSPVVTPGDEERAASWCTRLKKDHAAFAFPWLSEHLGWTRQADLELVLPLPLPFTQEAAGVVAARLRRLAAAVQETAIENSAQPFLLGDPMEGAAFLNAICHEATCRLVLDLHNVYTDARNFGFDPAAFVDAVDMAAVVQIHVSGGSESEADWLASGRIFRLDSHDGPVPEPVWALLEHVLPRCSGLRGIVVERLNGTFTDADIPALREEVRRARDLLPLAGTGATGPARERALPAGGGLSALQEQLAQALLAKTADAFTENLDALPAPARAAVAALDRDAFQLTGMLVQKLRFERLCNGDARIEAAFEADPERFMGLYRAYQEEVLPTAYFPSDEAALWHAWLKTRQDAGN